MALGVSQCQLPEQWDKLIVTGLLDFAWNTGGTHLSGLLLLKPGEPWLPPNIAMLLRSWAQTGLLQGG